MSLQLEYREPFFPGLQRLLIAECEQALQYLREAENEAQRHEAVHQTRKAFKKVRAGVRLIRDEIDYYGEVNAWFRDQARRISEVRDASAGLETLDLLQRQYGDGLQPDALAAARREMKQYRQELAMEVFHRDETLEQIAEQLAAEPDRIRGWSEDIDAFSQLRPSIRRVYKRGRKALRRARETRSREDFHEWRKRAKYLRYQLDILNRIRPPLLTTWEDELHTLTDLIGQDHDIRLMRRTLRDRRPGLLQGSDGQLLQALLDKQQDFLQHHALLLGEKFYQPGADDFCDQLAVCWRNHAREIGRKELPPVDRLRL